MSHDGPTRIEIALAYAILLVITFQHLAKLTGPLFADSQILTLGKAIILLTMVFWGVRVLVMRDSFAIDRIFFTRTSLLFWLNAWVMLFGFLVARTPEVSLVFTVPRYSLFALYFLLLSILVTEGSLRRGNQALVIGAFFACLGGLYELFTETSILPDVYTGVYKREDLLLTGKGSHRIQSFSGDPDMHATFLIVTSGLLLSEIQNAKAVAARLFGLLILILFLVNIVATGSRAGWIGIMITMSVFFVYTRMRFKWVAAGGGLITVVVLMAVLETAGKTPVLERLAGGQGSGSKSITGRLAWMEMSFRMFEDHPWMGVGTGNYFSEYSRYMDESPMAPRVEHKPNHNGYLQILAENGILGFVAFAALLLSVVGDAFVTLRTEDRKTHAFGVGLLASFVGFAYCIAVYPALASEFGYVIIAFIVSLSIIVKQRQRSHSKSMKYPD